VSEIVASPQLELNGLSSYANLKVLPLRSYDGNIGMDWLDSHHLVLDFYNKTFDCIDDEGNPRIIKDISRLISIRQISSLRM
jgi:hypothetical protein